jgi:hypothetical protein
LKTVRPSTANPAGGLSLKNTTSAKSENEFNRFADLTKKLVQVPKSEIDEKRKG